MIEFSITEEKMYEAINAALDKTKAREVQVDRVELVGDLAGAIIAAGTPISGQNG